MGYTTASTEWPTIPVPDPVKKLIEALFLALDNTDKGAGDQLADEIFTQDGVLEGHSQTKGTEEIRRCRDRAWNIIKSRRHEILKVYVSNTAGSDILLLGRVGAGLHNEEFVVAEFAARLLVSGADTSKPKISLYQVWMDSAPVTKALQKS